MSSLNSPKKYSSIFNFVIVLLLLIGVFRGFSYFSKNENIQGTSTLSTEKRTVKSGEEIFELAQPSTVRIGVKLSGTISTPEPIYDEETDEYYAGEENLEEPISTVLVGSGFLVDPRGYIVTNAHVVDVSEDSVGDKVWAQYSQQLYDNVYATLSSDTEKETIDYYYNKLLNFVSENGSLDNLTYKIAVFDPAQKEGSYEDYVDKGFYVQLKKTGEPYPQMGKDIAILKIDKEGYKALTLGNTKTLNPGSKIYVLGFPAIADINESGYTQPTFTSGIVSAFKKSSQGDYNVIQIDANSSGGNSGGPAFNEYGEIVGIATFGSEVKEGYNWILPVEFAKEFLDELNVKYISVDQE